MKKILTILSEYGYWGEELAGPYEHLTAAGYELVFATINGKRPLVIPASMDPAYIDPPLGKPVTSNEVAQKVKEIDSSSLLDNPFNLSEIIPERPYLSAENYLRKLEEYYNELEQVYNNMVDQYSALLLVGGGSILDMGNNQLIHDLVLAFYRQNKLIAAECYGVTCLAMARDIRDRKCILEGKHVTGHAKEYDYKHNYAYVNVEGAFDGPPYALEYILRDAVGPNGAFHGNVGSATSVILDYPFLTGRSVESSYLTGEIMVKCLEEGLKRYGW